MADSVADLGALGEPPDSAIVIFGDRMAKARRYAELLAGSGVEQGLIGPREAPRLWDRHILSCAVLGELIPQQSRVVDAGSGAGLPGIPLMLARPDLEIVLLEPMARRVAWLSEVVAELGIPVTVERGRVEEHVVRRRWEGADVVVARAVAPLARLASWTLPLLRPAGLLLALKGDSAREEIARDRASIRSAGGGQPRLVRCGAGVVEPPSTVVVVERLSARRASRSGPRRRARRG